MSETPSRRLRTHHSRQKQGQKQARALASDPVATEQTIVPRDRALVFISHDSRDAELAEAFSTLLVDVSGGTLKSFSSSDKKASSGLEFGSEWYSAIMSRLGDATDVVALLTRQSIDRPWILYEAGVAKGKLNTNVLGVALGVPLGEVTSGPFGQFQNCGGDEDAVTKLIMQLLTSDPDAAPREEAVRRQVEAFLGQVNKILTAAGKPEAQPETDGSATAKLFEEIKAMVRELPERVDDRVRSVARRGSMKYQRRIHPMMFDDLLFDPSLREAEGGQTVAWLMFISIFKEDIPWLYEIGLELYRALRDGNPKAQEAAVRNFQSIVKATTRGPLLHEMLGPDSEELYFMMRHLPEMTERFLSRAVRGRYRSLLSKENPASERVSEGKD